jgi:hypothetical protein
MQSSVLVVKRAEGENFEDPEMEDFKSVRRSEAD